MRASIEIPADGIWAAEGADKMSQEDWQLGLRPVAIIGNVGTFGSLAAWSAGRELVARSWRIPSP